MKLKEEDLERETTKIEEVGEKIMLAISPSKLPNDFGICSKCDHFFHQTTLYGKELPNCTYYAGENKIIMRPSRIDPIMSCTGFYMKGLMSLRDMTEIAVIIDPGKKGKIGF